MIDLTRTDHDTSAVVLRLFVAIGLLKIGVVFLYIFELKKSGAHVKPTGAHMSFFFAKHGIVFLVVFK
jgi:hypothetical protein